MSGIKVIPSIFAVVLKGEQVLLIQRANTGWLDGWYDLPAGHLEDQEELKTAAARELKEETGIVANPDNLKLIHVHQNHHQPEAPHYGYIFLATQWSGEPKIIEPEKCSDIGWFSLDKLPDKISPYAKDALAHLTDGEVSMSYHAPGSISH